VVRARAAWKKEPLPPGFLAKAAASNIPGPTYGEAAHHGAPWLYDTCRLNSAIAALSLATPVVPTMLPEDGAVSSLAWWASFTLGEQTHMVRIDSGVDPEVVATQYCGVQPCAEAEFPERYQQVRAHHLRNHRSLQLTRVLAALPAASWTAESA
jgi:hypothetical protein